mmetsp:Transcript_8874/g.17330  ORF Transcript_8874/g.17330 Transcript_8874/m.17330 type:complete len:249 (+) Transcript_8874:74-820(+)
MDVKREKALTGYSGYRPIFEKQEVPKKPHRISDKYVDTVHVENGTLGDNGFSSEYHKSSTAIKPGMYASKILRPSAKAYEKVPAVGWKSMSHTQMPPPVNAKPAEFKTQENFIGVSNSRIFRDQYLTSAQKTDFQKPQYTSPTAFNSTTADLAIGTTKGINSRLPGYAGHVSRSQPLQRKTNAVVRDSLTENNPVLQAGGFKHNKMGYTGHMPRTIENDRGKAVPANAKDLVKPGLRTGIAVPSMNLT